MNNNNIIIPKQMPYVENKPFEESRALAKICNDEKIYDEAEALEGILSYKSATHEVLHCNKLFLQYAGYKKVSEIVGKTDYDFSWQHYTNLYHTQEDDALDNKIYSALHPCKDANGRFFLNFNRKYPWYSKDGKLLGVISYSMEVHEPHLLELTRLLQANTPFNQEQVYFLGKKSNRFSLSEREAQCLFYIIRGKTAKQIARIMNISYRTVETYYERLKTKFNCQNRSELIEIAIRIGFVNIIPNEVFQPDLIASLKE